MTVAAGSNISCEVIHAGRHFFLDVPNPFEVQRIAVQWLRFVGDLCFESPAKIQQKNPIQCSREVESRKREGSSKTAEQ